MVLITTTPEATPEPTPTYAMSTKPPEVICGSWTRPGEVCDMPRFQPTPTPLPKCPTIEGRSCIATGKPESSWSTPKPTVESQY